MEVNCVPAYLLFYLLPPQLEGLEWKPCTHPLRHSKRLAVGPTASGDRDGVREPLVSLGGTTFGKGVSTPMNHPDRERQEETLFSTEYDRKSCRGKNGSAVIVSQTSHLSGG